MSTASDTRNRDRPTARREAEAGVELVEIVVAEGDEKEARLISRALDALENRVTVLDSEREAREYMTGTGGHNGERRAPDLMIVDEALLGDGCFRFLERVARQERFEDTEFALLVEVFDEDGPEERRQRVKEKIDKAYEAGIHYTVRKPVDAMAMHALAAELKGMGMAVVRQRRRSR